MPTLITIGIILAVVVGAIVLLTRKSGSQATSVGPWSAGPTIDGHDYSNVTVAADGSFTFPTTSPGVHYVTKQCGPLAGKGLRMRFRIDGDVTFFSANDGTPVKIGPVLYFERAGDNWSGVGAYETYRWWATFAVPPLTAGEHEIVAMFDQDWTAVGSSHALTSPEAFKVALANAYRVGFTFPGSTGYGHGCYAAGPATFTLLEFTEL